PSLSEADAPTFAAPFPSPVAEPARQAGFKTAPVEAPPPPPELADEMDDEEPALPAGNGRGGDGAQAVSQIIATLEARRKIMLALALEKAAIKIDGDFLVVTFAPENARDKAQLDGKDKRQLIEEISREVTGRRLTLSVSVGGVPEIPSAPARPAAPGRPAASKSTAGKKEAAEIDPRVQAMTEKFAGTVEIIKPE